MIKQLIQIAKKEGRELPDPQKFKVHCSGIKAIMAKATKGRTIPVGAETVAKRWIVEQLFNRPALRVGSRYTRKGIEQEGKSIELAGSVLGWFAPQKNEVTYEDAWLVGTPDVILENEIVDIKTSWDVFTFPIFEEEADIAHVLQVQGYLSLVDKLQGSVVYCLADLQDELIEAEAWKVARAMNLQELEADIYEQVARYHSYKDIPESMRVLSFNFGIDYETISNIRQRVEDIREWMSEQF